MNTFRSRLRDLGLSLAVITLIPVSAFAASVISEGYSADSKLSLGSIVSLKKNSSDQVEPATSANADNTLGIVINADSSLLSVSNGKENQVQVVTGGTVPVLVSDINGKIHRGDHITASPIAGIGMKATGNVRVVGIAQGDVSGETETTYKDKDGKEQKVKLGQASVLVNVAYYFKEPDKTIIPLAVQNVANALAGKSVNSTPILIAAGIFVVTLIVVVSIIYSMIRSSIISVGRNPMSQSAIYRDMIQMSVLVLGILTVSMVAIYLVLTRM